MLLTRILILIISIIAGWTTHMEIDNLTDIFRSSTNIVIYVEDSSYTFESNSSEYINILSSFEDMITDSREMPAFGVSLHNETISALKNGVWLEFVFDKIYTYNDMPFEKLLIQVSPDYYGFNIIRLYNGKYDGRCYYLDINKNMSELYNIIINTQK